MEILIKEMKIKNKLKAHIPDRLADLLIEKYLVLAIHIKTNKMLPNCFTHQIVLLSLLAFLSLFFLLIFLIQSCMVNNTLLCCAMNALSTKIWQEG